MDSLIIHSNNNLVRIFYNKSKKNQSIINESPSHENFQHSSTWAILIKTPFLLKKYIYCIHSLKMTLKLSAPNVVTYANVLNE